MNYIQASSEHLEAIYRLTQDTIRSIYPSYYPKEVVDFFCSHHSREAIQSDIENKNVWILFVNDTIVGTGSRDENHINRVFVIPDFQGNGYGSFIMQQLENKIGEVYDEVLLDASLCAIQLYEKRGYSTVSYEKTAVENGSILVYIVMKKELSHITSAINYDGKCFSTKSNTSGGDVNSKTVFNYHQLGDILWADYQGGNISKGFLVGNVEKDGTLDFHYQHINTKKQIRIGKCHSMPQTLDNGKISLHEEWQWLDGNCDVGSSVIEEM